MEFKAGVSKEHPAGICTNITYAYIVWIIDMCIYIHIYIYCTYTVYYTPYPSSFLSIWDIILDFKHAVLRKSLDPDIGGGEPGHTYYRTITIWWVAYLPL